MAAVTGPAYLSVVSALHLTCLCMSSAYSFHELVVLAQSRAKDGPTPEANTTPRGKKNEANGKKQQRGVNPSRQMENEKKFETLLLTQNCFAQRSETAHIKTELFLPGDMPRISRVKMLVP